MPSMSRWSRKMRFMPRRLPSSSSPTLPTISRSPTVCILFSLSTLSHDSSTARPRVSSEMPGALYLLPSCLTFTSVPAGNTVSRCAEISSFGPLPVPLRRPTTLPSASILASARPSAFMRARKASARFCSLKGGASISVSSFRSSIERSWSAFTASISFCTAGAAISLREGLFDRRLDLRRRGCHCAEALGLGQAGAAERTASRRMGAKRERVGWAMMRRGAVAGGEWRWPLLLRRHGARAVTPGRSAPPARRAARFRRAAPAGPAWRWQNRARARFLLRRRRGRPRARSAP